MITRNGRTRKKGYRMEWLQAVFVRWEALWFGAAGGALLAAIGGVRRWLFPREKKLPWHITGLVFLLFIILCSYLAFNDKSKLLQEEKSEVAALKTKLENIKPKLTLGLHAAYWFSEYPLLIALINVGNSGGSPTTVHDFEFTIGGSTVKPVIDRFMPLIQLRIGTSPNIDMVLLMDEFLQKRTMTPIYHSIVHGWILLDLREAVKRCSPPQTGTLSVRDVNNERYTLAISGQSVPPLPSPEAFIGFPDISRPFKTREAIKNMSKSLGTDVIVALSEACKK